MWWCVHLTLQFARWTPTRTSNYYCYYNRISILFIYPCHSFGYSHFLTGPNSPHRKWIGWFFFSNWSGSLGRMDDRFGFGSVFGTVISLHCIFWCIFLILESNRILSASFVAKAYSIELNQTANFSPIKTQHRNRFSFKNIPFSSAALKLNFKKWIVSWD